MNVVKLWIQFPFRRILFGITIRAFLRELEIESAGERTKFALNYPEEEKKTSADSDEQVKDTR